MKVGRTEGGWALLEVAASLALLSVLLGGLLQAWVSLAGQVSRTEALLDEVSEATDEASAGRAWTWGVLVDKTEWGEGPVLKVVTSSALPEGEVRVGFWVGGWFLGEYPVEDGNLVLDDPFLWQDRQGEEVVLRARDTSGGWGPPRRLLVPGGTVNPEESLATIVVHAPGFAHVVVEALTAQGRAQVAADGCAYVEAVGGTAEVRLGGLAQAFRVEGGRRLDLVF